MTTQNPKSSAQQVKTDPKVVELVDMLLDGHIYPEIADILNSRESAPAVRRGKGQADAQFTALRVAYLANRVRPPLPLRPAPGSGIADAGGGSSRLGICESTLIRWVEYGLVTRHAYNAHAYLYEAPSPNPPIKHSSRWDPLTERVAAIRRTDSAKCSLRTAGDAV